MIQINTTGWNSENYSSQYGSPTVWRSDRIEAVARLMARGIITEWGGSRKRYPEDKYITNYKPRFARRRNISAECDHRKAKRIASKCC